MTQEELAERADTKQPAIARLESGRYAVSTKTMERIAEALDATLRIYMEPSELIGREKLRPAWWERSTVWEVLQQPIRTKELVQNITVRSGRIVGSPDEGHWVVIEPKSPASSIEFELRPERRIPSGQVPTAEAT